MKKSSMIIVLSIITALLLTSIIPTTSSSKIGTNDLELECVLNSPYFDAYGPIYITGSNPTLEFYGSESFREIHIQIYSNTYGGGFFASAAQVDMVDGYASIDLKDIIKVTSAETGEPYIEATHQIGYYGMTIGGGSKYPSSGFKYLVKIKGSSYGWDTNMEPIKVDNTKPTIHQIDITGGIFSKVVTVTATDGESGMRLLNVHINGEDYNNGQIYGHLGGEYMTYVLTLDKKTSLTLKTIDVFAEDMAGHKSSEGDNIDPTSTPPETPDTPSGPSSGDAGPSYEWCTCADDPDQDDVKYGFDWGDGSGITWTNLVSSGEQECVSHQYSSSGDYTIKAIAKDEYDLESSWSSGLTVSMNENNLPPYKPDKPSGPSSVRAGPTYEWSTSTDDPDRHQIKYGFDWNGDGNVDTWTSYVNSGETVTKSHQYSSSGQYTIKVIAKDEKDAESEWSTGKTVTISENSAPGTPSKPTGEAVGDIGNEYEYSTYKVTDPDGDKVSYLFDWGDGSNSGWIDSLKAKHIWTKKGEFTVTVKAKDQYGATSSSSNPLTINMNNDAPDKPAIPTGPADGETKETLTFTTSSVDPNGHKVKYYFTWGDGDNDWTELTESGLEAAASHTWTEEGTFEIKLKAVDEYGEESEWSDPVNIEIEKEKSINRPLFNLLNHRFNHLLSTIIQQMLHNLVNI